MRNLGSDQSCSVTPGRGRGSGTLPRTIADEMRGRGGGIGIGPAIGSLASFEPPGGLNIGLADA